MNKFLNITNDKIRTSKLKQMVTYENNRIRK